MSPREFIIIVLLALGVGAAIIACALKQGNPQDPGRIAFSTTQKPINTSNRVYTPEPAITSPSPLPTAPVAPPDPPAPVSIAVSVAGAVAVPGLYRFTNEARVQDLIDKAGGTTENADVSDINLAAHLIDATTLTIPEKPAVGARLRSTLPAPRNIAPYTISGWQPSASPGTLTGTSSEKATSIKSQETDTSGQIDLNTATQAALETLPGIGPKLASQIVSYRNAQRFTSVEDLTNVPGIGDKRMETLRPLVKVSRGTP